MELSTVLLRFKSEELILYSVSIIIDDVLSELNFKAGITPEITNA